MELRPKYTQIRLDKLNFRFHTEENLDLIVALIIPVYNENLSTLHRTFTECSIILKSNLHVKLVVVDDGSSSNLFADLQFLARKILRNVSHEIIRCSKNKGYGNAVNVGLKALKTQNVDWAIVIDSELSMRPVDIEFMLNTIEMFPKAAIIKASRYLNAEDFNEVSGGRRILSIVGRTVARVLTLYKVSDPTSGFRALKLKYVDLNLRKESGFSSIVEELRWMTQICMFKALTVVQVPYRYQERDCHDRQTSFTFIPSVYFSYLKHLVLCFIDIAILYRKKYYLHSYTVLKK